MKCPQCGTSDPTGTAQFCSFCFESFKPKAAAKAPVLFYAGVTTEFGYWETAGALLITREAIYCLVERLDEVTDKKSIKGQMQKNLSDKGLLGTALSMAMAGAFEEKRPLQPEEVHVKFIHWDQDPFKNLVDFRAQVGAADQYFILDKKSITEASVDFLGRFTFTTANASIKTSFLEDHATMAAFLRSSGFPVK